RRRDRRRNRLLADRRSQRRPVAGTAFRLAPGPVERSFQAIIAPKKLAVGGDEARRAEYTEPFRNLGIGTKLGLDVVRLSAIQHGASVQSETGQNTGDSLAPFDRLAFPEFRAVNGTAIILAPGLGQPYQGDTRGQQGVSWEYCRPHERQAKRVASSLKIAPHVAAFRRKKIEWRCCPTLRLENWPQHEWSPANSASSRLGKR